MVTMANSAAALRKLSGRQVGSAVLALAGVLWLCHSAFGFTDAHTTDPQSALDYVAITAFSAALLGLLPALLVLRSWGPAPLGTVGAFALVGAGVGAVIAAIGNFAEDALGVSALGDGLYLPGALLLSLGLLFLGIALLRAPSPGRWIAAGPLITWLAWFTIGNAAGLVAGPVWIALGSLLWAERGPFRPPPHESSSGVMQPLFSAPSTTRDRRELARRARDSGCDW